MMIHWNDRALACRPRETVAAALRRAGIVSFGATSGGGRYFCGIGLCQSCVVLIDGERAALACLTIVREGMTVSPILTGDEGNRHG